LAGVYYDHGVYLNAVGYIEYDIPNTANRLVGLVGIDDVVKLNTASNHKASASCTISIDGVIVWQSEIFRVGEYFEFDIIIPDGAKKVRFDIGDAGDGIECDNVSIADAGWQN